jgi:hypothetical protein
MTVSNPPVQTEGLGQLVTGTAVDNASNAATDPVILNIDTTPPTITSSMFPSPNAAGWNNTAVIVAFSCADPKPANGALGSGIATCTTPVALSTEGVGQTVTGNATDSAGNGARATVSGVNIDETPPTITFASQTPAPNANGWNNGPVTVSWTCADGLSGPVTATVSATLSGEGANPDGQRDLHRQGRQHRDSNAGRASTSTSPRPPWRRASRPTRCYLAGVLARLRMLPTHFPASGDRVAAALTPASVVMGSTARRRHGGQHGHRHGHVWRGLWPEAAVQPTTLFKSGTRIPLALQLQDAAGSKSGCNSPSPRVINGIAAPRLTQPCGQERVTRNPLVCRQR